jgi:hypothetical protein
MRTAITLFLLAALLPSDAVRAVEVVTFKRDDVERTVAGRLLITAEDGGLLLEADDGELFTIPPEELVVHNRDETEFEPLDRDDLATRLLDQLPTGFETHKTAHYLICYNTSRAYAVWCGGLFERLYMAFTNYWSKRGFDLHEPEFPLVAIVFNDQASYRDFAQPDLGDAASSIIGYYSLRSNRINTYDLTGIEALRKPGDQRGSPSQINELLMRPEAERTVATLIHEATHQIAFNSGLQTRYADIPLWVSEGIAVYFETPDLSSPRGWRTVGAVNRVRLAQFRDYQNRRPADSLKSLITSDVRIRDPRQAADAYAEAWALNYFLIKQRPKQFQAYLKTLSQKSPLIWDEPEQRLAEFTTAFGDVSQLDADFLRTMGKVR